MKEKMTLLEAYEVMFTDYPDVVNVEELCRMLGGVGPKVAYHMLQERQIESIRVGREYRIPKLSVISFLLDMEDCPGNNNKKLPPS